MGPRAELPGLRWCAVLAVCGAGLALHGAGATRFDLTGQVGWQRVDLTGIVI